MLQPMWLIRVYIPVQGGVWPKDANELQQHCPAFQHILEVVNQHAPVGVMGDYTGVFELQYGLEGFVPQAGAMPTQGKIGEPEVVASAVLTVWAPGDLSQAKVDACVRQIAEVHPWEHPVIEVWHPSQVRVWGQSKRKVKG